MRDEEQPGGLHAALARMVWWAAPSVRLHYDRGDDTLVAELGQADAAGEIVVLDHLLVELDGTDADAMPTALYLTGVRADPDGPAASMARELLGERVWASATALVAAGSRQVDVQLDVEDAAALRRVWCGLAARLQDVVRGGPAMIGVEFIPGRVHAVLTDSAATVLDDHIVDLDRNDPAAVVAAIAEAARVLAGRHPGTAAATCPISVQLGGPVTPSGLVEFYDKPLVASDESWKPIPLGELVQRNTNRRTHIFNDARAMAVHEIEFGLGRTKDKVAVLVVRQGVGAKLILRGEVADDFPMEIGTFVATPGAELDTTPDPGSRSIEAGSGVQAIVRAVQAITGQTCTDIDSAARVATTSPAALDAFYDAGAGLARGMAAIQAVINPDVWAVCGPAVLVDERQLTARAFLRGLDTAMSYLDYSGLGPAVIQPRSTNGPLGGQAAAVAALLTSLCEPGSRPGPPQLRPLE